MMVASMPFDDTNIRRMIEIQLSKSICKLIILHPNFSSNLKNVLV